MRDPKPSSPFSPAFFLRSGHALITLTIVGVLVGVLASMMESTTHFLSDLKLGYCKWNFFAPEYVCCKEVAILTAAATPLHSQQPHSIYYSSSPPSSSSSSSSSSLSSSATSSIDYDNALFSSATCSSFVRWSAPSNSLEGDYVEGSARSIRGFVCYVGFSVIFAALAAMICSLHHPQSVAGSGLPQVKSILSGGRVLNHFLSFPVILAKSCALVLAVGSGLFIGKEGPLVHLGVAIGTTVRRTLRKYFNGGVVIVGGGGGGSLDRQRTTTTTTTITTTAASSMTPSSVHDDSDSWGWGDNEQDDIDLDPPDVSSAQSNELLCAAAAAGVSAGFAAPLGGLLYVVEELSFRFPRRTMIRSFLCAITATLTLKLIDATYTGRPLQFSVDAASASWRWGELIVLFPLLGVFCGLVGGCTVKLMQKGLIVKRRVMEDHVNKRIFRGSLSEGQKRIAEVCLIALLSAVVNYTVVPQYLDRGAFEVLHDLFVPFASDEAGTAVAAAGSSPTSASAGSAASSPPPSVWTEVVSLFLAGTIRVVMFAFAFGIQVPAGSLVPSLFVGACFGRAFGMIMVHIVSNYATQESQTNWLMNQFFSCASSSFASTSSAALSSTTTSSDAGATGFDSETTSAIQNLFARSSWRGISSFYSPSAVDDQFLDDLSSGSSSSSSSSSSPSSSSSSSSSTSPSFSSGCQNSLVAPGMYAALGAAATLTGVTRMTMCLVMIVVELTGAPSYVLPCTVVCLCAKRVVEWLEMPSIFDLSTAPAGSCKTTTKTAKKRKANDEQGDESTHFFPHPPELVREIVDETRSPSSTPLPSSSTATPLQIDNEKDNNDDDDDDDDNNNPHHELQPSIVLHTLQDLVTLANGNSSSVELCSGMSVKQVRDKLLAAPANSTAATTFSRLQPVLIVTRDERIDRLPVLLGISKAGKILDEILRHCSSTDASEERDIVTFTTGTKNGNRTFHRTASAASSSAGQIVNFTHLFETSYLSVATTMNFSVLFERLQHDVDTTCVVVMDQLGTAGGVPVAAFSRQFLMEQQPYLPSSSNNDRGEMK